MIGGVVHMRVKCKQRETIQTRLLTSLCCAQVCGGRPMSRGRKGAMAGHTVKAVFGTKGPQRRGKAKKTIFGRYIGCVSLK